MNNINFIQNAIMQLEGGAFQKLFDAYLYKKYKFNNIQTLGVQTGTNKTTKGTPDAYVLTDDKKYILINYGTVSSSQPKKYATIFYHVMINRSYYFLRIKLKK